MDIMYKSVQQFMEYCDELSLLPFSQLKTHHQHIYKITEKGSRLFVPHPSHQMTCSYQLATGHLEGLRSWKRAGCRSL